MPTNFRKDRKVPSALTKGAPNPQSGLILKHLRKAGRITQRQAMADYSVQSLTKRISELRGAGFKIEGNWKKHPITGQRYMEYLLSK